MTIFLWLCILYKGNETYIFCVADNIFYVNEFAVLLLNHAILDHYLLKVSCVEMTLSIYDFISVEFLQLSDLGHHQSTKKKM